MIRLRVWVIFVQLVLLLFPQFPVLGDQDDIDRLHFIAEHGRHQDLLPLLRRFPGAVRWRDPMGLEPLHRAVRGGNLEMVEFLVQHGANLDVADGLQAWTPLHHAAFLGYPEIARFLLARGAKTEFPDSHGNTPLHLAARNGKCELVSILLLHGSGVDPTNMWDRTPLQEAVMLGAEADDPAHASASQEDYLASARELIAADANVNTRDAQGRTTLTLALDYHCPRNFCDWLRQLGAKT